MEIVSYKKRSGNLYEVELDNGEKHKIYDDLILKYELLIDKKVDQNKLDQILKENALYEAYFKALKYISIKMRSELEVRKYLSKCGFSPSDINNTIDKLKSSGYLDSERYVKAYINDAITLSYMGPKKIKDSLEKLGIDETLIDNNISLVDDSEWISRIEKIVAKKSKTNKNSEKMFRMKITSELLSLGYYIDDVKDVVENFSIDTSSAFIKEADKIYRNLSAKYEGNELVFKFKNKMYSRGYSMPEINSYLEKK